MKKNKLKELSYLDLQKQLIDARARLLAARFRQATGSLHKTHELRNIRTEIAQILTFLRLHKAAQIQQPTNLLSQQKASFRQAQTQITEAIQKQYQAAQEKMANNQSLNSPPIAQAVTLPSVETTTVSAPQVTTRTATKDSVQTDLATTQPAPPSDKNKPLA